MALILFEIAAGIYVYTSRDTSEAAAKKYLKKWINEYGQSENAKKAIDVIQKKVSENISD